VRGICGVFVMVFCSQKVGVFSEEACVVSVSSICGCAVSERFLISDIQNYIRRVAYIRYLKSYPLQLAHIRYPKLCLKKLAYVRKNYPISDWIRSYPFPMAYIRLRCRLPPRFYSLHHGFCCSRIYDLSFSLCGDNKKTSTIF